MDRGNYDLDIRFDVFGGQWTGETTTLIYNIYMLMSLVDSGPGRTLI